MSVSNYLIAFQYWSALTFKKPIQLTVFEKTKKNKKIEINFYGISHDSTRRVRAIWKEKSNLYSDQLFSIIWFELKNNESKFESSLKRNDNYFSDISILIKYSEW